MAKLPNVARNARPRARREMPCCMGVSSGLLVVCGDMYGAGRVRQGSGVWAGLERNACGVRPEATRLVIGMPGEGFEPPTFGLQNRCTTTVLTRPQRSST